MSNEITMAEDILRHVHTAELYKTAQGEHVLYGNSSQVRIDPTDMLGQRITNRIHNGWHLFDKRVPNKYKNPHHWNPVSSDNSDDDKS